MRRIRWYHLYIVLAGVNVVVIAAGLWLHHRTLASFQDLLGDTARFDARERDMAALSEAVMQLAAPAGEVFATRDVATQRERFRRFQLDAGALKGRLRLPARRLEEFWAEVGRMCRAEAALFDRLEAVPAGQDSVPTEVLTALATFDSHRRRALRLLASHQEALLSDAAEEHLEHAAVLKQQSLIETGLAVALVGALAGMIVYTRKLQQTDQALRTERRRVEEERRERLALIGELCTGVAHGIQNPLTAIRSSSELILELGRLDDDSRRRAEDVLTECTRLSQRVRRLLNFARAAEPLRIEVLVSDVVRDVARELSPRFHEHGIDLDCDLDGAAMVIEADPDELGSVFLELLSNALDHTPAGGRVVVRGRAAAGEVVVEVSDSGPGVAAGTAEHIFDLFFTTKQGGSGVGLARARRIVKSLNGELELASPGGRGATFRVRLPRGRTAPADAAPTGAEAACRPRPARQCA